MNVYVCLTEFSAPKIVTWICHVDEFTNGKHNMILGRDILTAQGLDLEFSENIIIGGKGPYKICSVLMVDLSNHDFTSITYKTVKPEESFINSYVDKCLKSESAISSTISMCRIIDAKYEKSDLNTVMAKKCQYLNATERYRLLTF